jgi:hypothetical protein
MELRLHTPLTRAFAALFTLAAIGNGFVRAAPDTSTVAIKQFPLDERTVYEIPIGHDMPTTIMFPSELTAIEGANVATSPDMPAPVMLSYTPGRYFFSVRAQAPDPAPDQEKNVTAAATATVIATVNVIWKNRTFVIRFYISPTSRPYGSVTFYEARLAGKNPSSVRRVNPEGLLELLDRAKSWRLIHQQYPEAVQQIEHRAPQPPGNITRYRDFSVTVEEIFRFDPEDTLVFKIMLHNPGFSEIVYQPQSLAARIGHRVYHASVSDAAGIIPPQASTPAWFAITGTPDGARANLSVKNDFSIIVPRLTRDAHLVVPQ